jgi:hypothetical protein
MARRWKWLSFIACAVPLAALAYDRSEVMSWVGHTDLEVEFAVAEAGSGTPVPGVRVEVKSDGGFYEEREKQEFVLVAAADGVARKVCRGSMCFGRQSRLGLTDTYAVHRPFWRFRVTAPGYEPTDWAGLDDPEFKRPVQEVGPRRARLIVPVSLRRSGG